MRSLSDICLKEYELVLNVFVSVRIWLNFSCLPANMEWKDISSKNVLFVLSTVFPYEDELVKDIYMALAETFSETKIALVAIQFSAAECKSYTMLDGNVCIKKCERSRDDRYDTQFTAPEWKWMDDLSLADRLSPANIRRKTIVKLKYKYILSR